MMIPQMKSCRIQVFALVLAGLIAQPAHAEVIPGRWEKVSDLELRTSITVELKNGDQVEGHFKGLSASELELETHSARAMIPKADIQTITAPAKDGLAEGAAIGTAIGAGFVGVMAAKWGLGKGLDTSARGALVFALFAVGTGAALGIAADASNKSAPITLYVAPGTPRRSKHGVSEWWPLEPPTAAADEPENSN